MQGGGGRGSYLLIVDPLLRLITQSKSADLFRNRLGEANSKCEAVSKRIERFIINVEVDQLGLGGVYLSQDHRNERDNENADQVDAYPDRSCAAVDGLELPLAVNREADWLAKLI
jgi:hypothetical protein